MNDPPSDLLHPVLSRERNQIRAGRNAFYSRIHTDHSRLTIAHHHIVCWSTIADAMESQDVAATDHSMLQELMFDKQIFDGKPLLEQLRLASSLPSQSRVRQRITDNGWCPHLVNYHLSANRNWLKQEVDLDSKQMLETRSIESRDRHTVCRDSPFCKAYDVDKTTYRPKHVRPDCNCKHVSVPQQEIADIILSGNFPVLTVKSGHPEPSAVEKGGALEVVIEKGLSTWSTKSYVAVSHVWAQGLGNPIDNALPTCQLSALKRRLDALGTSVSQRLQAARLYFRILILTSAILAGYPLHACRPEVQAIIQSNTA